MRNNEKNRNHEKLNSRDKRLKAPRGSYEAQRWLAAEETQELETAAKKNANSDVFLMYHYVACALQYSVDIAKMTRAKEITTAANFVAYQVRLFEYVERIKNLKNLSNLLKRWPKNPGITFGWQAGRSALEVAIEFAEMIYAGTVVARGEVAIHGATSYDSLSVSPKSDPAFAEWCNRTIEELLTHELPKPDIWPYMADIHRDYRSLLYKMDDEYNQFAVSDESIATGDIKQQKSRNSANNKKFSEKKIKKYDVFICHASEDKKDFVKPLADALRKNNLKVWYDEFELKLGDKLREKIDYGLANSSYGVVVLSKAFFTKDWPKSELDGLVARQNSEGRKVILPIWHKATRIEVQQFSPMLAGLVSAKSREGLKKVVAEILSVCLQDKKLKTKLASPEKGTDISDANSLSPDEDKVCRQHATVTEQRKGLPDLSFDGKCPFCGYSDYKLLTTQEGGVVEYRKCANCGSDFTFLPFGDLY